MYYIRGYENSCMMLRTLYLWNYGTIARMGRPTSSATRARAWHPTRWTRSSQSADSAKHGKESRGRWNGTWGCVKVVETTYNLSVLFMFNLILHASGIVLVWRGVDLLLSLAMELVGFQVCCFAVAPSGLNRQPKWRIAPGSSLRATWGV